MSEYSATDGLKYAPIRFMGVDGSVSDHPPGRPVVQVVLRYDPDHSNGPRAPLSYRPIYALLDTGADQNYATPDTIMTAGCPQTGASMTHGATAGATESTQHLGHLFFPEAAAQLETQIFSATLRNSPATEHLIIGMHLIECGVLIMNFKKDIYRLYLG